MEIGKVIDLRNEKKFSEQTVEAVFCIAMPTRDKVPKDLFWTYLNMIKPKHYFITAGHVPIDEARNWIVKQFLVNMPDATHLVFWDSDIIPPIDGLVRLFKHDKAIVSGLYFQRYPPHRPHIYILGENRQYFIPCVAYTKNTLIEVEGVGMGFCMIRRDVLQADAFLKRGKWFGFDRGFGEDFDFCLTAREAGYKIYVDTGVVCKHMADQYPVDETTFMLYQEREKYKAIKFK